MIAASLFLLGQLFFVKFFHFAEPSIPGIAFQVIERPAPIKTSILFSLTLALIPILLVCIWRLRYIVSPLKKILSIITIFIFLAFSIFLRHEAVKIYFTTVVKPVIAPNDTMNINYPIDPVRFVYNMLCALVISCIALYCLFAFRRNLSVNAQR